MTKKNPKQPTSKNLHHNSINLIFILEVGSCFCEMDGVFPYF